MTTPEAPSGRIPVNLRQLDLRMFICARTVAAETGRHTRATLNHLHW